MRDTEYLSVGVRSTPQRQITNGQSRRRQTKCQRTDVAYGGQNCQAADTVYMITYLEVWQEEFLVVTGEWRVG